MPNLSRYVSIALRDPRRAIRGVRVRVQTRMTKGDLGPNSTTFARDARPGPTATAFHGIRHVPGWFTYDDAAHFTLALNIQAASGITGDVLEIGSYHGRSTALLARNLQPGERLTVCDPFQTGEVYVEDPPTPDRLRANVLAAVPGLDPSALEIVASYSKDLDLAADRRFRLVHVDGSHERDDVALDLEIAVQHLLPGGIIVADDHDHPDWPGVTEAIIPFRAAHPELVEVADLNRHAESGRKLYLMLPRT